MEEWPTGSPCPGVCSSPRCTFGLRTTRYLLFAAPLGPPSRCTCCSFAWNNFCLLCGKFLIVSAQWRAPLWQPQFLQADTVHFVNTSVEALYCIALWFIYLFILHVCSCFVTVMSLRPGAGPGTKQPIGYMCWMNLWMNSHVVGKYLEDVCAPKKGNALVASCVLLPFSLAVRSRDYHVISLNMITCWKF